MATFCLPGRPVTVTRLQIEDLEAGQLKSPWSLQMNHESVAAEETEMMMKVVAISMLLSFARGDWNCSDEVNKLLGPAFKFTDAEPYLRGVWERED